MLSGKARFGWGRRIGFDNTLKLSYEKQKQFRPNDPFLYAWNANELLRTNKVDHALKSLRKAAQLIPKDTDPDVDVFDIDRANILLFAARISERQAKSNFLFREKYAKAAALYYNEAANCLNENENEISPTAVATAARAYAILGDKSKSFAILRKLEKRIKSKSKKAWLLCEYASVSSLLGDHATSLSYLEKSFQLQPRWDCFPLRDPNLRSLVSQRLQDVQELCCSPLIGAWETDDGIKLYFYVNNKVVQVNDDVETEGNYSSNGRSLRMITKKIDKTFTYKVSGNTLKLGENYVFSRKRPPLFGKWTYGEDEIEFFENGRWIKTNSSGSQSSGSFSVLFDENDSTKLTHLVLQSRPKPFDTMYKRQFAIELGRDSLTVRIHRERIGTIDFVYRKK